MTDTPCRGVQKGSWRSLCVVNEVLYYKGRTEICAYDGSVPVAVSAPFFGWLCSFGGDIKLLAPESAVDALREHLRKFAEAYQI